GSVPVILRSGAVSVEELRNVVPETVIYRTVATERPRSPGMRHRHYSPRAKVVIVDRGLRIGALRERIESLPLPVLTDGAAYIGLSTPTGSFELERICASVEEYAHSLFEFFRECDRLEVGTIYCEEVAETGVGAAIMDRLLRAAVTDGCLWGFGYFRVTLVMASPP